MLSIIPLVKGKISVVTGNLFRATIKHYNWTECDKKGMHWGLKKRLSDGREITTKPCWILQNIDKWYESLHCSRVSQPSCFNMGVT